MVDRISPATCAWAVASAKLSVHTKSVIAILQRVLRASVTVDGTIVGQIGPGLLALVAVAKTDGPEQVAWMARKIVGLRVFRNGDKHFDVDVQQAGGGVLLVSNFTVAAATRQGRRPSFDAAAEPEIGRRLFDALVEAVRASGVPVATGQFGADMQVELVNDGPVTVIVDSDE
jgi:D-tyrosyl-tRNA(Tyr) deacylase